LQRADTVEKVRWPGVIRARSIVVLQRFYHGPEFRNGFGVWLSRAIHQRVQFIAALPIGVQHFVGQSCIYEIVPFLRVETSSLQKALDELSDIRIA
jgi:hypothetical protein